MKRYLKRTLWISGGIIGLILLIIITAALLFFFDKPLVRNLSQKYLSKKAGLAIEIGKLNYTISPLHITISSLKVSRETKTQKMEVFVSRLEAKGEFKKLLNLEKPVFETVEAEGAELRLEQKTSSEEETDYQNLILQAAEILGYARKLSVKDSRITASFLPGKVNLEKVNLGLSKSPAENTFAYALDCENAGVETSDGRFSFACRVNSAGTLALAQRTAWNGRLTLASLRIAAAGFKESFKTVTIEGVGELEAEKKKLSFSKLSAGFPELAAVSGNLVLDYGNSPSLRANAEVRVDDLGQAASFLKPHLPRIFQDVSIQGKTAVGVKYDLATSSQGKQENIEASLAVDRIRIRYAGPGLPLRAELSGQLKAEGSPADLRFAADIQANIGKISGENFEIQDSSLHLRGKGNKDVAAISSFEGALKGLAFVVPGGRRLSFEEARLKGKARLDINRKTLVLDSLEARLPLLSPVQSSVRLNLSPPGLKQASLVTRGLKITALRELLSSFIPESLKGWEFDGDLDISVEAQNSAARREGWDFSADLTLARGKFNDPAFTAAGDGLAPRFHLEGQYNPLKSTLSFSGSLELSQGESLWKDFYISWAKYPVKAAITASYSLVPKSLDAMTGWVVFPTLGEIQVRGSVLFEPPLSFNLQTNSSLSLESFYSLYFQAGAPEESRLNVKGTLESKAEILRGKDALSIKGRLTWSDGSIEKPGSKFAVRGLKADVPIRFETEGTKDSAEEETLSDKGSLKIEELQTTLFFFQSIEIFLRSGKNAFEVDPFSLDIFGGKVEFGKTSLAFDPKTLAFKGVSSLRLSDMEISRVPINSTQFKLSGNAAANFSRVDISPQKISAQGQAEIDIFGGKVVISDLSMASPFSKARVISSNVDLVDLDLKKVTDAVPFGEVTGIIRGEIRDLAISYGQPERFDLRLESVKKKGVPQTFSLKAVDDLTVISSGQQASMGTGKFWMRYVHGFRYEKIGIVSTLRNDAFTLSGTIKQNGVEYLVKKPWLFGINVIDRDPEKKISFKEMMNRLKRVAQSEK
jgi:hypothetical protein